MAYICHGNEHFVLGGPVSSNTYQPGSIVGAKPIGIIAILAYSWNQQLAISIIIAASRVIGDILLSVYLSFHLVASALQPVSNALSRTVVVCHYVYDAHWGRSASRHRF